MKVLRSEAVKLLQRTYPKDLRNFICAARLGKTTIIDGKFKARIAGRG